jgi:hypothetical protein
MGPAFGGPLSTTCQMGDHHWGVRYEERERERSMCCMENRRLKEKGRGEQSEGGLARAKVGWLGCWVDTYEDGFGQTWWILGFWGRRLRPAWMMERLRDLGI